MEARFFARPPPETRACLAPSAAEQPVGVTVNTPNRNWAVVTYMAALDDIRATSWQNDRPDRVVLVRSSRRSGRVNLAASWRTARDCQARSLHKKRSGLRAAPRGRIRQTDDAGGEDVSVAVNGSTCRSLIEGPQHRVRHIRSARSWCLIRALSGTPAARAQALAFAADKSTRVPDTPLVGSIRAVGRGVDHQPLRVLRLPPEKHFTSPSVTDDTP